MYLYFSLHTHLMEQTTTTDLRSRSIKLLIILFLISVSLVCVVFYNMPHLEEGEKESIKLPR